MGVAPVNETPSESLNHGYGGNDKPASLSIIPDSWHAYIQLARLFPPAGLFLIYFPHLFGVLHAAVRTQAAPLDVLNASILMFAGSFFFSNAGHIWNDLIDADLDAKVERSSRRPIPRGAISKRAAFIFALTQGAMAAWFLTGIPAGFTTGYLYALPNILVTLYYPFAKRHTHMPQLVLGVCLAWGVVMGELAMDVRLFTYDNKLEVEWTTVYLFMASVLWTIIYDTLYAHQDLKADLQVGIKSLAVLFQGQTKTLLWPLLVAMAGVLVMCGKTSGFGAVYYVVAVGGGIGSLCVIILMVDLSSTQSCWWWFSKGFWSVGVAITAGLLGEYYMLLQPALY
ncbi:uncharacterized protein N7503_010751 [Penicillium pulvis]|uniref:uncharacterized protein n=1 Tax=Penicillium pulvis TaxID=1562058 RepID=UPI002547E892|nr:uncharacterized protein N7503_010751 [Penicillium pulvis]KAJ5785539.1 hypothetical protein N7503_010751 [Penicillium pulvis]